MCQGNEGFFLLCPFIVKPPSCPQRENAAILGGLSGVCSQPVTHSEHFPARLSIFPFFGRISQGPVNLIILLWLIKIRLYFYWTLGLIIDAFGELRDQQEQVKEDMEVSLSVSGSALLLWALVSPTVFIQESSMREKVGEDISTMWLPWPVSDLGNTYPWPVC